MIKIFHLFFWLLFSTSTVFSQDLIIRNDGSEIPCKIISEDSVKVDIIITEKNIEIKTHIEKDLIKRIIYYNSILKPYSDPIVYKKETTGYNYYLRNEKIKYNQYTDILYPNRDAYQLFLASKKMRNTGIVMCSAGSLMLGCWLIESLMEYKTHKIFAGAGAGLLLISLPCTIGSRIKLADAIKVYNQGIERELLPKPEIGLGFTGSGIGLYLIY